MVVVKIGGLVMKGGDFDGEVNGDGWRWMVMDGDRW